MEVAYMKLTSGTLCSMRLSNGLDFYVAFVVMVCAWCMEVSPVNTAERLFCIMLLVLGMLFSATIVSLISSETMSMAYICHARSSSGSHVEK
eukprot:4263474-Amphidinium_carterae.1